MYTYPQWLLKALFLKVQNDLHRPLRPDALLLLDADEYPLGMRDMSELRRPAIAREERLAVDIARPHVREIVATESGLRLLDEVLLLHRRRGHEVGGRCAVRGHEEQEYARHFVEAVVV